MTKVWPKLFKYVPTLQTYSVLIIKSYIKKFTRDKNITEFIYLLWRASTNYVYL